MLHTPYYYYRHTHVDLLGVWDAIINQNFGVKRLDICRVPLGLITQKSHFLKGLTSSTLGVLIFMEFIELMGGKQLFIATTVYSLIIDASHYTSIPQIGLCYPSKSGAVTFPCPTGSFISSCISSLFLFLEFILASTSLLICPIWFAEIECTQLSAFWDIVKFDVYSIKNWVRI